MAQTIIEKVIDQAVRNLRSAGCQFAVITPDGRKLGELAVDQPKKYAGRRRIHNFAASGYIQQIEKMSVGDVLEFTAPADAKPEEFRKAIIATAVKLFGNGNATSHITGDKIELMRLA